MRWPWVSRARLDAADARAARADARTAYWQTRAERLIDATILKAGIAPLMSTPPDDPLGGLAVGPFAGMAIREVPQQHDA